MNKLIKHLRTVVKHRWHVLVACTKSGYLWRGLTHDLSKFSMVEFLEYAKFYEDGVSPRDVALSRGEQFTAWQHHKGHNPHHWQYWIDIHYDKLDPLKMPQKYVAEMICDWVGAGKAYNKAKWSIEEFKSWYGKNRSKMLFHPDTLKWLDGFVDLVGCESDIYLVLRACKKG